MEISPAERQVEEIESLCMNCYENGTTRLLLTRIPYFREIVIMSFECPQCNFKNTEIQSAGDIQQRGVKYVFKLDSTDDLQRQVVKSDTCVCRLEEIDVEIPAGKGRLTNVEGILSMVRDDLEMQQPERKEAAEELYAQIQVVITKLSQMIAGDKFPFTLTLDDTSGNSTIEPSLSEKPGKYIRSEYPRTAEQNEALGLAGGDDAQDTVNDASIVPIAHLRPEYHTTQMYPAMPSNTGHLNVDALDNRPTSAESDTEDTVYNEVFGFPASCPGCMRPCTTNMKMVEIPHFEQVVIMSTVCDDCGYRSNEVKSGGEVPQKGRKITLKVLNKNDLSRDILKGESCALSCPELNLNVESGTLGGRFTTVEGLLTQVRDDLKSNVYGDEDEIPGDSMANLERVKWNNFFQGLDRAINGEIQFTVILEDPLAGSYVQSFTAPEPDAQITSEEYDRTEDEKEYLGLNDIKTEGYEEDALSGAMQNTNLGA